MALAETAAGGWGYSPFPHYQKWLLYVSLSTLVLVKHLISYLIWIKEPWFYLLSFWYIYIYIYLTLWTSFKIARQNILTFQFLPLIETLKFMLFQFILKMELEFIHISAYSKFYPKAMTDHQKMCVYQYTVFVDFCTDTLNKASALCC